MGTPDKEGSGKDTETGAQKERVRFGIEVQSDVEITSEQVEAALDQAFGPGHGMRVVSIKRSESPLSE